MCGWLRDAQPAISFALETRFELAINKRSRIERLTRNCGEVWVASSLGTVPRRIDALSKAVFSPWRAHSRQSEKA